MIIPEKIIGRNKIRDAAICVNWERLIEDKNYPTIESIKTALSLKFKLSELRIFQIVRANHAYIPTDKKWEKTKRIHRLKLEIKQQEKSKKDVADLLDQLRIEMEGEKSLVDASTHYHFTTIKEAVEYASNSGVGKTRDRVLENIEGPRELAK